MNSPQPNTDRTAAAPAFNEAVFSRRDNALQQAIGFEQTFKALESEVGKVIVGLKNEVRLVLASVFTGGHVLMEGTPGLAKTLLAHSISKALGLDFNRIQFTPDLLPGDITGSMVQTKEREFEFRKGPVFADIVLADEINRSTPKTQAALLEAMQEKQVSADGTTYKLSDTFLVLATQNSLESAGTYPLPDAQMDRFSIKLDVKSPTQDELKQIFRRTTSNDAPQVNSVFEPGQARAQIMAARELVRGVQVSSQMEDLAAAVIVSLDPRHPEAMGLSCVKDNIWQGPSPRGGQAAILLAKVFALLDGRAHVTQDDMRAAFVPALRHRLTLKPEQMSEGSKVDSIIQEVAEKASKR